MRLAALLLLLALAACHPGAQEGRLTPDEVKLLAQTDKGLFFLDVSNPDEIERLGSKEGYVNIPMGDLEGRLDEIPRDRVIVTACTKGIRAARAATLLKEKGYKVRGSCSLDEWKAQGNPVVQPKKEEGRP